MLQSLKDNRERLRTLRQLDKQRLRQANAIHNQTKLILRHLHDLEVQLELCENMLRSISGG